MNQQDSRDDIVRRIRLNHDLPCLMRYWAPCPCAIQRRPASDSTALRSFMNNSISWPAMSN